MHLPDDPQHQFMCGDSPNPGDFLSEDEFEERRDNAIEREVNRLLDAEFEKDVA